MPTAIFEDTDFKEYLQNKGFNCNTIISKKINDKDEVEIFWTYKEIK